MKTRTLSLSLAIAMVISLVSISNVNAQRVANNEIVSQKDKQSIYYQLIDNFELVKKFQVSIDADQSFFSIFTENNTKVYTSGIDYRPGKVEGTKTAYIFRVKRAVSTEDCLDFIKIEKGELADVQGIVAALSEIKSLSNGFLGEDTCVLVQSFSKKKCIPTFCIMDGKQYFWLSRSKAVKEKGSYILFFSELNLDNDFYFAAQ